jgi:hypothetical protein
MGRAPRDPLAVLLASEENDRYAFIEFDGQYAIDGRNVDFQTTACCACLAACRLQAISPI